MQATQLCELHSVVSQRDTDVDLDSGLASRSIDFRLSRSLSRWQSGTRSAGARDHANLGGRAIGSL
jgi:hypothetical protein